MNQPGMLIEKLEKIKTRWDEIGRLITEPSVISDMERHIKLSREYKDLKGIVDAYLRFKKVSENISSARHVLETDKDEEFRTMAKRELEELSLLSKSLEEEIKMLLLPKNPEDEKDAIVEIRAGSGGNEASIFTGDLYRMYLRFCEDKGWKTVLVDYTDGTMGGFKEVIFNVSGKDVYGILKYESGVHRVQRVPKTESQGRIHTSAASVVVLPEADEFDVVIKPEEIKKDTFCSSGAGGQSVNTTYSAVRLTHIPTGVVVSCQDQRSQIQNYERALVVLRTRLYETELQKRIDETAKKRKTIVSTGDRSAKIRTYNFAQGRVTDHRIGLTLYELDSILNGNIHKMIDALQVAENAERLKEG